MPTFRVRVEGAAPWDVELTRNEMTIGRSPDCDISIDGDGVSREHAVLRVQSGKLTIEDLDSRNGTFVNGERIERRGLRPGDRVRLGPSVELELVEPKRGASKRPAPSREKRGGGDGLLFRSEWALVSTERGRRRALPIRARVVTVGRKGSANLALEDESVSRMHARLDREGSRLFVTDLKSRNGTRVNEEPALRAELNEGDEVSFGDLAFEVRHHRAFAWDRIAIGVGALVALVAISFGVLKLNEALTERATVAEARPRLRRQAMQNIERGIDAYRKGDVDFARGYLLNAANMLLYLDLAPRGASLTKPADVFRTIAPELPSDDQGFDFAQAFSEAAPAGLENLPNRDYVTRRVRAIAIELGLDQDVPSGFADQVWTFVDRFSSNPRSFQPILDRAPRIQPVIRSAVADARLPEVFCFVAWNESALDPQARSAAGARGLWQLMPATARELGLRVDNLVDERVDVDRSTQAATRMIANLLRVFGREQFMCALASYNQGPGAVRNAMMKIRDPMMEASKKYWYLVENGLIPRETSEYVAKIFANMIIAENPERFGFKRPAAW
ncbi:MAG TPA: FHA domain-containing protein [Candidatus Sulfotelmatobacter sp.]|nr:FHA domain-containing protein [Candidatus Sulfotelmatobacter sp.]